MQPALEVWSGVEDSGARLLGFESQLWHLIAVNFGQVI
jgi:hypothetical protein